MKLIKFLAMMTQEDKELLTQDLSGRFPYGIRCEVWYNDKILNIKCTGIDFYTNTVNLDIPEDDNAKVYVDNIKPYLFPLSSMTGEQRNQLKEIWDIDMNKALDYAISGEEGLSDLFQLSAAEKVINWLNKYHFDYRGLIGKGLAIDATNKNIY